MDTIVNDFVQVLRGHRLQVSPAGSIDALNALQNTGSEERETGAAVRRIAWRSRGAKTRRLKEDRIGHISVPHTLRHNVRYEGVPFDPVLRKRREGKPCVALLCDISLTTRNLARFWLHMIYQMRSLFSKVRTFVFVVDVAEVVAEGLLKARA